MAECSECNLPPRLPDNDKCTPKVIQIENPGEVVIFRKVVIPAPMTEEDVPPVAGLYRNVFLLYEANNNTYIYSSDGQPTRIMASIDFNDVAGRPKYAGQMMTSDTEIPAVYDATLVVTRNGETLGTFSANAAVGQAIDIEVPTKLSDLENDSDFVEDADYVHTDNNYDDEDKDKVDGLVDIENIGQNLSYDSTTKTLSATAQPAVLYSSLGQNTDGALTQKAATDELNTKATIASLESVQDSIPTALSQLENDDDFVQDADYVHTDNNYTNSDKLFVTNTPSIIPEQASSSNQLADKAFVNSSLNSVTAYYITKDAQGTQFSTKADLDAATTFYSGGAVRVPTRNDYCIVLADETKTDPVTSENPTTRYSYQTNGWEFQYIVNKTTLTAVQLAALNSGITSTDVTKLSTVETGAQKNPTNVVSDASYVHTDNNYTTSDKNKLTSLSPISSIGANLSLSQNGQLSATDTTYGDFTGATSTTAGTAGLVPAPAIADAGKFLKADGTWATAGGSGVQYSDLFTDGTSQTKVKIGKNAASSGDNSVAIGAGYNSSSAAQATRSGAIAIGGYATAKGLNSVAIGYNTTANVGGGDYTISIGDHAGTSTNGGGYGWGEINIGYYSGATANVKAISFGATSHAGVQGEIAVGPSTTAYGYNNTHYRLITGVHDPQSAHDAATKGYVDAAVPVFTYTTTDPGEGADLAAGHFIAVYE